MKACISVQLTNQFVTLFSFLLFSLILFSGLQCKSQKKTAPKTLKPFISTYVNEPAPVGKDWEIIVAGFKHTCGIRKDSSLWCWGNNGSGQVGDGTLENRPSPVRTGKSDSWLDVGLGDHWSCAVQSGNSLWCWGAHKFGSAEKGQKVANNTPALVNWDNRFSVNFSEIAPGDGHACGLTMRGIIYCWGAPERLGNGSADYSELPVPISSSQTFKALTVGSGHSCGLGINGMLYCWGRNDMGQVGIGNSSENIPLPSLVSTESISGSRTFMQISAGTFHTCAVMEDGDAYCWGGNKEGRLGNGNTKDQRIPAPVDTSSMKDSKKMAQISAGFSTTCAVAKDGLAYCWGDNCPGKIYNGPDTTNCSRPELLKISTADGTKLFHFISAGNAHSCAVTTDGTGFCWGNNEDGRIGIGTPTRTE
jgi:alpha-tubulin suppressor-like RCC1 family protein